MSPRPGALAQSLLVACALCRSPQHTWSLSTLQGASDRESPVPAQTRCSKFRWPRLAVPSPRSSSCRSSIPRAVFLRWRHFRGRRAGGGRARFLMPGSIAAEIPVNPGEGLRRSAALAEPFVQAGFLLRAIACSASPHSSYHWPMQPWPPLKPLAARRRRPTCSSPTPTRALSRPAPSNCWPPA